MSVKDFLNYESYLELQNKQLEIFGQPCTIYHPTRKNVVGYEDTRPSDIDKMNVDKTLGNVYEKRQSRIWINFTIPKSVFYKFNWFPEDGEELCMAFLNTESQCNVEDYVRSATSESTSIWGDMIFKIVKIQDVGLSQVLQRIYFLKPTANEDLHRELDF